MLVLLSQQGLCSVAEVCGELASLVPVSDISLLEGEVCKASAAVDSLNLRRQTTLAAGSYHGIRPTVGFVFFFKKIM